MNSSVRDLYLCGFGNYQETLGGLPDGHSALMLNMKLLVDTGEGVSVG